MSLERNCQAQANVPPIWSLAPGSVSLPPPHAHDDEHGPLSSQWEQVAGQRQVLEVVHPASPLHSPKAESSEYITHPVLGINIEEVIKHSIRILFLHPAYKLVTGLIIRVARPRRNTETAF